MATRNCAMPLEPLLEYALRRCATDGGQLSDRQFAEHIGVSSRTVARWRADQDCIPWPAADSAAVALGTLPVLIWGELWEDLDYDLIHGGADEKLLKEIDKAMKQIGAVLAGERAVAA